MNENIQLINPDDLPSFDVSKIKLGLPEEDTATEDPKEPKKVVEVKKKEEQVKDDSFIDPEEETFGNFNFDPLEEEEEEPKEEAFKAEPTSMFEAMSEMGLLLLPDDFEFDGTEESLQAAIDADFQAREELAEQKVTSKIENSGIKVLVEAALAGGDFLDLEKFFKTEKQAQIIDSLDVSTEDKAENFLRKIYKNQGLKDAKVEALIDQAKADETILEDAEEEKTKEVEKQRAINAAAAQAAKERNKQREADNKAYEAAFTKALKESEIPLSKKQRIMSSFGQVEVQGTTIPEWQYKIMAIQNNHQDFVTLLGMLADYDPKKGLKSSIKEKETAAKETKTNTTLLDKLKKGAGTTLKGSAGTSGPKDKKPYTPPLPFNGRRETI